MSKPNPSAELAALAQRKTEAAFPDPDRARAKEITDAYLAAAAPKMSPPPAPTGPATDSAAQPSPAAGPPVRSIRGTVITEEQWQEWKAKGAVTLTPAQRDEYLTRHHGQRLITMPIGSLTPEAVQGRESRLAAELRAVDFPSTRTS